MELTQQQQVEFLEYLEKEVVTTKSDFIKAMHERMTTGKPLTENMVNALNKCIGKAPVVKKTFKMKKWWTNQAGLDSRIITCEIKGETDRAYRVEGHADIFNGTQCIRCNRKLTQPAAITIGLGEECAKQIGVEFPKEYNKMSQEETNEYKERLLGKLHNQKVEWVPKSQIEEVIE